MPYPTVSVIIPTYNRAHLVDRAIRSVLAQTYTNIEVIVVDDGSTDQTQAVVESFADNRIRYIFHSQNSGINITRNTGIDASQGEYIAFLDSDDEWLPEKLEKQIEAFSQADSQVGACYTWIKSIHETTGVERLFQPRYQGFIFEELLYSCFTNASSMMVKRECFQTVGKFDTDPSFRSCEDWELWLRIAREYHYIVVPEVLSIWWEHDSKNRNTNNAALMLNGFAALLKKHPEMQQLPHTFKKVGSAPLSEKGHVFFERGRRYMLQSSSISHAEGMKIGKSYLKMAFLAEPQKPRYFANYLVATFLETKYPQFIQLEKSLRNLMK